MNQDPAFLFYSKDFYEGTRLMLPEERACYIDLLIYQHQNGCIPNDVRRLQLYCSGCSAAVIQQVLNLHFKQTDNGWLNQRLQHETQLRQLGKPKKIAAAVFAGLISGTRLTKKQKDTLKKNFDITRFIQNEIGEVFTETQIKQEVRKWFNQMVNPPKNQSLTIHEDVNANENEIEDKTVIATASKTKLRSKLVIYPWESTEFKTQWQHWKTYKAHEFGFTYQSSQSEQAALTQLAGKAENNMATAIAILHQSMANGWKGFFPLQQKHKTNEQVFTEALGSEVGRNFTFK